MTTPHAVPPILGWLAAHAAAAPGRVACTDGASTRTWEQLAARVADGGARLAARGIGGGRRVAIVLPNGVVFVETLLAVLRSGAAAFPLSVGAPRAEVVRVLARTPVTALVATDAATAAALTPAGVVPAHADAAGLHVAPALARPAGAATGREAALVAWSPGTTGAPYLVTRTHAQLAAEGTSCAAALGLTPDDAVLGLVPLSHAYGLGVVLLAGLRAGARLVLRARFARRETLDVLVGERVSVSPLVPFMAHMLTTVGRAPRRDLGALRLALTAGAALPRSTWDAFRAIHGVPLRQLYGLTEAGAVTVNLAPEAALDPASVGTPLPGVEVRVCDVRGRPCDVGEAGDVVVRTPAAARGAGEPLPTGDRGYLTAAGALVLSSRTSRFVNHAGNKVDPAEVEAILRLHPAVAEARVSGEADVVVGEMVVARVVARDAVGAEALRAHCRIHLAGYKVPRVIRLVATLP